MLIVRYKCFISSDRKDLVVTIEVYACPKESLNGSSSDTTIVKILRCIRTPGIPLCLSNATFPVERETDTSLFANAVLKY